MLPIESDILNQTFPRCQTPELKPMKLICTGIFPFPYIKQPSGGI